MSDPEINYNPKRHHNVNESIKKNEERKRELLRLVGRVRVYFFRIYFLSLIIVSIFLLVYYWPHQTFEDRITSINSTLSIDAEKLQSIES